MIIGMDLLAMDETIQTLRPKRQYQTCEKIKDAAMKIKRSEQRENDLPTGLAQPAQRALASAGIRNLEQLTKFTEAEIMQLHGIGPNALAKLHRALRAKGFSFADKQET